MPGLDKLLKGVLKYRETIRTQMVKDFQRIREKPEPKAVMVSCIDSRVIMTRLLQSNVGDMLLVRNAGNLVPHSDTLRNDEVSTEVAALELGCVTTNIRHVVVCGHSDCKAMTALFEIRDKAEEVGGPPLASWIKKHGLASVKKYRQLEAAGGVGPITFEAENTSKRFTAFIDRDNQFAPVDKFSQVNTLQQLENIVSHGFMKEHLGSDKVRLNAMWFDIYTGDVYMFSRERQSFIQVTKATYAHLVSDGESW
ncbi:Beta carbonic anhydrase 1 [Lamellibrachia satsuma]|nr:Beta carbonic anhydrase 1 [Lamellibrachia satsuma]